ncbi:hypothetical protein ANTRET_LOCUS744 [Anthophora retusa]
MFNDIILQHRFISTGKPRLITDKQFQRLKLNQAKMQCEDNLPVYLKCGTRDKVLFGITVAGVVFNTFHSFKSMKRLLKEQG